MTASEARVDARAWRARAESQYFPEGIQGNEWQDEAAMYLRAAVALDAYADRQEMTAEDMVQLVEMGKRAEREACAAICDDADVIRNNDYQRTDDGRATLTAVARAIRARGTDGR